VVFIRTLLNTYQDEILAEWQRQLVAEGATRSGRITEAELANQCQAFIDAFAAAVSSGSTDINSPAFGGVRDFLSDTARHRAVQGYTPSETAGFVFSLKKPLFDRLSSIAAEDPSTDVWALTHLLDQLGLLTMEVFQRSREEVILRQQQEISELSTPVVQLWKGVLALPLIGTLDSVRTQVVMESLLQNIVDHEAEFAIIDITGVPTVDTLTAQYLLKTVSAARLMGAECIISGIRPQIAQTIVHLGVELDVISKATLAEAFAMALQRTGRAVTRVGKPAG